MQVPLSTSHRVRVHLTHVPAPVFFVHVSNVQIPRPVIIVGERDPGILGDDVVVDGQNRLSVYSDPCDLQEKITTLLITCLRSLLRGTRTRSTHYAAAAHYEFETFR